MFENRKQNIQIKSEKLKLVKLLTLQIHVLFNRFFCGGFLVLYPKYNLSGHYMFFNVLELSRFYNFFFRPL